MTDPALPSPSVVAAPPARRRYVKKPRTFWQRVPKSVWILLPAVLVSVAWAGWRAWDRARTVVTFALAEEREVPALDVELFPEQLAFNQPSPPPPLLRLRHDGGSTLVLANEGLPQRFLLRWSGAGIGTGVTSIVRGRAETVRLAPPASLDGRVGEPVGFLGFGLRSLGLRAKAGARVLCMGGGEHGVVLAEAVSDGDGRFRLEGFASDMTALGLRVLANGCAANFVQHFVGSPGPVLPVIATRPVRGRVVAPPEVLAAKLLVLAKGLPGVQAEVAPDGTFELDHVPPNLEPRLLVHGLPAPFTHALVRGQPGQDGIVVDVVAGSTLRGRVLDRMSMEPRPLAMVWHDNGPAGGVTVQADEGGWFQFERVPAGKIEVRAQFDYTPPGGDPIVQTGVTAVTTGGGLPSKTVLVVVD